jgi:cytochrome b561|nr:cytochrome b [Neorhizobium tomejilense]
MKFRNTKTTYGAVAVSFHWASAVLATGLFASGLWMTSLSYGSNWYHSAPEFHKAFGLMFAALILGRLAWKGLNPSPDEAGKRWEALAAKSVHIALYGLLATLFVSGYLVATGRGAGVDIFGVFQFPSLVHIGRNTRLAGTVHLWSAYALAALTVLHAAAALKHHFIDRDRVLVRMLGR